MAPLQHVGVPCHNHLFGIHAVWLCEVYKFRHCPTPGLLGSCLGGLGCLFGLLQKSWVKGWQVGPVEGFSERLSRRAATEAVSPHTKGGQSRPTAGHCRIMSELPHEGFAPCLRRPAGPTLWTPEAGQGRSRPGRGVFCGFSSTLITEDLRRGRRETVLESQPKGASV